MRKSTVKNKSMLTPRWSRAIAVGALVLVSVALIVFVASVFSRGTTHMGMKKHLMSSRADMGREMRWMDKKEMMSPEMGMMAEDSMAMSAAPAPMMGTNSWHAYQAKR